jgi:amino acid adenylation domain-containing protein
MRSQPTAETSVERIFKAAARWPNRPAIRHNDDTVDFERLMELQEKLASHVSRLCPGPGGLVGVCMERSVPLVVSLLAIHRTGNAFVPMEASLPRQRLGYIMDDCKPDLVLAQRYSSHLVSDRGVPVVVVDDVLEALQDENTPPLNPRGGDIAYVIYTSGSTGDPKGVSIPHAGVLNQITWRREHFSITENDRVAQTFSLAFDPSVWEVLGTLEAGACVVIGDDIFDASRIASLLRDEQVTILQTVPSMLTQLLAQPAFGQCSELRHVICGGQALEQDTVRRFYDVTAAQLHNLYGMAEVSCDATHWLCSPDDSGPGVPIGAPIASTRVLLLDEDGQEVPVGEPGEIHIAGPGVSPGYYMRPELTAAKFVSYAGAEGSYGLLYKTGDRGIYRAAGVLDFIGRADRQIKRHGYRVEPGEIEAALASHPAVEEVVVVEKAVSSGEKALVAYLTVSSGHEAPSQQQLRDHVAVSLPSYMVPSVVVQIDSLPRVAGGKVDLGALPDPNQPRAPASPQPDSGSESASGVEQRVAKMWCEALDVDSFDPDANFFELGGTSASLTMCIVRMEEEFGRRTAPGEFFTRSFRQLVGLLELGE